MSDSWDDSSAIPGAYPFSVPPEPVRRPSHPAPEYYHGGHRPTLWPITSPVGPIFGTGIALGGVAYLYTFFNGKVGSNYHRLTLAQLQTASRHNEAMGPLVWCLGISVAVYLAWMVYRLVSYPRRLRAYEQAYSAWEAEEIARDQTRYDNHMRRYQEYRTLYLLGERRDRVHRVEREVMKAYSLYAVDADFLGRGPTEALVRGFAPNLLQLLDTFNAGLLTESDHPTIKAIIRHVQLPEPPPLLNYLTKHLIEPRWLPSTLPPRYADLSEKAQRLKLPSPDNYLETNRS